MVQELTLYHGSRYVIEKPVFGKGNPYNDYGPGFYCTETLELAQEWGCTEERDGFANRYTLDMTGLTVLNLSDGKHHILNWLAILLVNRRFTINAEIAAQAKAYLVECFLPDYEKKDIIIGYRADDSYFSFATAFLNNTISLAQLEKAMFLGKLGEQVVLKSETAFSQLQYKESTPADRVIFYPKKAARDSAARAAFREERSRIPVRDAIYMIDILREEWDNDDTRLRRSLSE